MPWCPICKNEYREGFTYCSGCNAELVESLPVEENNEQNTEENFSVVPEDGEIGGEAAILTKDDCPETGENTAEETVRELQNAIEEQKNCVLSYHPYQNSADKAEDNKSSAFTLLAVGGIGLIADILVFIGVIPAYQNAGFTKYLVCGVMGALFLLFIVFGIVSMRTSKILLVQAKSENSLKNEITKWCEENLNGELIDSKLAFDDSMTEEQKYFVRVAKITDILNHTFINLDQAFVENFVDEYYQRLYEQE